MGTRSPERPFQWKVTLLGKMVFEWFENDLVRGLAKVGPINRIFSNWASVSHAKCQSLEKWSGYTVVLQGVFSHFLTQFISKTCDPLFLNKQHRIPAKLHPAFCCNPFEKDISLFVIIDHHELLCILSIITTPQINSYILIADSDIPTVWDGGGGQAKLPRHHQVSRGQKGLSGTWASKWAEGGKVALRWTHEISCRCCWSPTPARTRQQPQWMCTLATWAIPQSYLDSHTSVNICFSLVRFRKRFVNTKKYDLIS